MCSQFTLHHKFRIDTGMTEFDQKTVFFLPVDPMDEEHKDPETADLKAPRHAQYMHKAWKKHQDAENLVDIDLALKKGWTFYQTRSNAIILHETLPAHCIPKVVRMETGEVIYEKVYVSPRPPPKISLKHVWKRELGSGSCWTSRKLPTNPTEPKSNYRTRRPVTTEQTSRSSAQEIDTRFQEYQFVC